MAAKEERGGNGKKAEAGEMEEDGGQFFGRLDIIRPRVASPFSLPNLLLPVLRLATTSYTLLTPISLGSKLDPNFCSRN